MVPAPSRVDQHVAIGIATEHSATTRLKERTAGAPLGTSRDHGLEPAAPFRPAAACAAHENSLCMLSKALGQTYKALTSAATVHLPTAAVSQMFTAAESTACVKSVMQRLLRRMEMEVQRRGGCRRRDCHDADTPSPYLLKHLLQGERDAAE